MLLLYPLVSIFLAYERETLFKPQTVKAGNGISVTDIGSGLWVIITGVLL